MIGVEGFRVLWLLDYMVEGISVIGLHKVIGSSGQKAMRLNREVIGLKSYGVMSVGVSTHRGPA